MSSLGPLIDGTSIPRFLYGTAWKEDRTAALTEMAIRQGFRGIDTANQRKHYDEAAVGRGIAASIKAGLVDRSDLFLQTKFTFQAGQDHRLPYDPSAPIPQQVEQSCISSLGHLDTTYLDSFVLHGPSVRNGLAADDFQAWRAMESLHDRGFVRMLGVSNVTSQQLELLCDQARVLPGFVQNRCYASTGWDRIIRLQCAKFGVFYQGFSLLTANRAVLASEAMAEISRHHNRTPEQIVFRYAIETGMIPLTGTTDMGHMAADLSVLDFGLSETEVSMIDRIGLRSGE